MLKRLPVSLSLVTKSVCFFTAFSLLDIAGNVARAQQNCLPVHGLSFERVSRDELLAVRDGQNIAFLSIVLEGPYYTGLPEKLGVFRFFSQVLCTTGAENRFHIDGRIYYVRGIQRFANPR